ncbi:MAG: hypothetical protein RLW87_20390 [Alphaproteobacteria bacterium]
MKQTSQRSDAPLEHPETAARIEIDLGGMAPAVSEQLQAQGFTAEPSHLTRWNRAKSSICALRISGFASGAESERIELRILQEIAGNVIRKH